MANSVAAARRPAAGALAVVRAIPVWLLLAGLIVLSTGIRYALGRRAVAPWIMVDELIYSELAKSFAAGGHFLVRDHATAAYGFVYPMLISPAWALFAAVPKAYAAAKAINALLMSLAAVPAYFLARRVMSQWLALLAAVLSVAVPSMVYTGTLMTENAFYPLFLCAALATVLWLERPTAVRTILVLGVCLIAFLTRVQTVALLPALLTAPLLASGRRAWRDYRLMYGIAAVVAAGVVIVEGARGKSPLGVLGAYEAAGHESYTVSAAGRWILYHVAELDLSLGVLPFAALLLLAVMLPRLDRPLRIFVAVAVPLAAWLVLEVALFASMPSVSRVEERTMFYVAPLFLIALLAWIERGLPRPAAATAGAALVAAALPGVLPYSRLINLNAVSDTPAILAIWSLQPSPFSLEAIPGVVVLASVAGGLLFLLVPRRLALVLPALVLVYFAVSEKPVEGKHRYASVASLYAGITNTHLDWIDRAVGRDAHVVALWSGNTDRYSIWENEIFSRSVGTIYDLGPRFSGGLAETPVQADLRTGLLRADRRPIRAGYVLTDGSVSLAGVPVARDARKGMILYRVNGLLRQTSRVEGLYPQDTWSGATVRYVRLACRGGALAVLLDGDPSLFHGPQTVTASEAGALVGRTTVTPGRPRRLSVPLRPSGSRCSVTFTVRPTAVPAVVTRGQNPDTRVLGIHFSRFSYTAPAG